MIVEVLVTLYDTSSRVQPKYFFVDRNKDKSLKWMRFNRKQYECSFLLNKDTALSLIKKCKDMYGETVYWRVEQIYIEDVWTNYPLDYSYWKRWDKYEYWFIDEYNNTFWELAFEEYFYENKPLKILAR